MSGMKLIGFSFSEITGDDLRTISDESKQNEDFVRSLVRNVLRAKAEEGKKEAYITMCFPEPLRSDMLACIKSTTQVRYREPFYGVDMNLEDIAEKLKDRGFSVTTSPYVPFTRYKGSHPFGYSIHIYNGSQNGGPCKIYDSDMDKLQDLRDKLGEVSVDLHVSWKGNKDPVATAKTAAEGCDEDDDDSTVDVVTATVYRPKREDDFERV